MGEKVEAKVILGDCVGSMAAMPEASVHAIVTDPPYDLVANKRGDGRARIGVGNGAGGFMGKAWDSTGVAFKPETWAAALRVLKPGGYLLAFGGTRTHHRMVCAIEDAGFEVRDCLMWLYGSGFPKSKNLGGEWDGWGTALKPAWEPIIMARKPFACTVAENMQAHGTGALNIDGCRVGTNETLQGSTVRDDIRGGQFAGGHRANPGDIADYEQHQMGRWPANLIHDGSEEVLAGFPQTFSRGTNDSGSAARFFYCAKASASDRNEGISSYETKESDLRDAGRFNSGGRAQDEAGEFYETGSAPKPKRNTHPTVKPVALMRWLVRLVTTPGGVVLDPFMGSGTTGVAAKLEGFGFIGCEVESEYIEIARARIGSTVHQATLL